MALPSKPVRKPAKVGVNVQGKPVIGPNKSAYVRKSAQPFGHEDKTVYKRPSVGITPNSVPVNDKDARK
jgi:hypothetical protein